MRGANFRNVVIVEDRGRKLCKYGGCVVVGSKLVEKVVDYYKVIEE